MTRTQIYLPDDTHASLLKLAKSKNTSLSELIRQGAQMVLKKNYGRLTPQQKALKFFANPNKKGRIKLDKPAHLLVREDRDGRQY